MYESDYDEDGEPGRIRYWLIAQLLDGQCRIYTFSYAYLVSAAERLADEIVLVDREVRRMIPYPEPV